jgi:protocatechuate 4,5-dioxygenase alpha subunit
MPCSPDAGLAEPDGGLAGADAAAADTYVFDLRQAHRGAALNRMCYSLGDERNRRVFLDDEHSYMRGFGMSARQMTAIKARDWLRAVQLGGNPYLLIKVGATVGAGLYHQGAQQRGESYDEFLATRNVPEAT